MKNQRRQEEIIKLLKQQGEITTDDLVIHFAVSAQTIRRDLNELAKKNYIKRTHGGATLSDTNKANQPSYHERKTTKQAEKKAIANYLAQQIPDGATLFVDVGTTPEAIAEALVQTHKSLFIVTNSIHAAMILMQKRGFKVILAGGQVRNQDGGVTGEATLDFIAQFRLDYGILGIAGLDYDGSLLDFDYHESRAKRAIIKNSRSVLLGIDHSKFGRNAMVNLGNLGDIDLIVTDQSPPAVIEKQINANDTQLAIVTP